MIGKGRERRKEGNARDKETTSSPNKEGKGTSRETKRNNIDPSMKMNVVLRSGTRRRESIVVTTKMKEAIETEVITETTKRPDIATREKRRTKESTENAKATTKITKMREKIETEIILKIGAISARKKRICPEEVSGPEALAG